MLIVNNLSVKMTNNDVIEYTPLVRKIAQAVRKNLPANIEHDDLMQAGYIGLMQAIKSYKVVDGAKFETFANSKIKYAMLDELRDISFFKRDGHHEFNMTYMGDYESIDFLDVQYHSQSPLDKIIKDENFKIIIKTIKSLPPLLRTVIFEYYINTTPIKVIGSNINAIDSRVSQLRAQGIKILQDKLNNIDT